MVESNDGNARAEAYIAEERSRVERSEAMHDELFVEAISKKLEVARGNGLHVGACFYSPKGEILAREADEVEHAASINKLAVAAYVVDRYDPRQKFVWNEQDVIGGAGIYDQAGARRHADTAALLEDMLVNSGNTAMKVLVNGQAEEVNRYLDGMGFEHTRLEVLSGGKFYTGTTSAREAIFLMRTLAGEPFVDETGVNKPAVDSVEGGELGHVVSMALRRSNRSVVWRRLEKAVDELELAAKVGELSKIGEVGDSDYNPNLQNEVGMMYGNKMYGNNEWLAYSVFLSSDQKRSFVAKQIIGQIGSEIANYVGVRKRLHVPTFAMAVALRASGEKLFKL